MIQCGLHAIVSSVHTFIPSLALVTVTSARLTLICHANPYRVMQTHTEKRSATRRPACSE